jgi:hypothetical protein
MQPNDRILNIETLRLAIAGMSRSLELGGRMEAHYPVALISAFFFTRDNQMPNATRNAVVEQVNALIRQKADLLEPLPHGPYSPFAGSRILKTLENWNGEADRAQDLWRGGHAFKYCYSFYEIKRAFPKHPLINCGEEALQWLL